MYRHNRTVLACLMLMLIVILGCMSLPKVDGVAESTIVAAAGQSQPADDQGAASLAAPRAVALEQSKSPELLASIGAPVAMDFVLTPPSVPVADTVNAPSGSTADPLNSDSDLDTKKQEQTRDAGRGIPISNAGLLLISILGSFVGEALARFRGMIIGAALGPIIQVAVQICGICG
jgi:hypothetical protein